MKQSTLELVESYKQEINEKIDEKCRLEMHLMNQISQLERENITMAERHAAEWRECNRDLQFLKSLNESRMVSDKAPMRNDESELDASLSLIDVNVYEETATKTPQFESLTRDPVTEKMSFFGNKSRSERRSSLRSCSQNSACSISLNLNASQQLEDTIVAAEDALHQELKAKDERIVQLQEELYQRERIIMKWNRNSEEALLDELMGYSQVELGLS
eukprot:CAMPEP_0118714308 /NCGR_PEP_ID=MMETSP0800-20121206/26111_1 /TAXON_ID=210618 ORGANISM="Striatella unipunctata, Strain CCMP2910" /NCGR_SAMPLE_ID=MMETSP0800 /ASSEMBLY_ACC=CAM_ASM_000638 /LENGTH=216 /DNA_ID=CAMNT_0006620079 /DNA_START=178 /DNA_END=829 /DNA_ORIENTATION=-